VLVEGVLRLRQWKRYGTFASTYYALRHDPASGLEIPKPLSSSGPIRVNSLGFRGPEIEPRKPAGRIRLAFLGGSTTFCAEASSEDATWPAQVVAALERAHPARTFDLVNGGTAGYTTTQSLRSLRMRVAPLEPDAIVIYHATNDLTHDSRTYAAERGIRQLGEPRETWLERRWLTGSLLAKNLRFLVRNEAGADELSFDPREVSPRFQERLSALVEGAREVAPVVVVVTFSHRARREQTLEERRTAASSSRYYMPFLDAAQILAGFEEYNRVIREVARETGVVLIEGEETIPGDEVHFVDSVHFTDRGCARQAQRVFEGLEEAPAFRALLAGGRTGG